MPLHFEVTLPTSDRDKTFNDKTYSEKRTKRQNKHGIYRPFETFCSLQRICPSTFCHTIGTLYFFIDTLSVFPVYVHVHMSTDTDTDMDIWTYWRWTCYRDAECDSDWKCLKYKHEIDKSFSTFIHLIFFVTFNILSSYILSHQMFCPCTFCLIRRYVLVDFVTLYLTVCFFRCFVRICFVCIRFVTVYVLSYLLSLYVLSFRHFVVIRFVTDMGKDMALIRKHLRNFLYSLRLTCKRSKKCSTSNIGAAEITQQIGKARKYILRASSIVTTRLINCSVLSGNGSTFSARWWQMK